MRRPLRLGTVELPESARSTFDEGDEMRDKVFALCTADIATRLWINFQPKRRARLVAPTKSGTAALLAATVKDDSLMDSSAWLSLPQSGQKRRSISFVRLPHFGQIRYTLLIRSRLFYIYTLVHNI